MSLEDVASLVGKTRQYLHKVESHQTQPTDELTESLAEILNVEAEFFWSPPTYSLPEDLFHFRKQFTTRALAKQVTLARGELVYRIVALLEKELKLPSLKFFEPSACSGEKSIEDIANLCRAEWGLGNGPISNMTRLAEYLGAIVTSFSSTSKEVDALSVATLRPVIVRNDAKESICRQRFDIAHEIGHLILHSGIITGDRKTESEANRFASAFLIPSAMMIKLFPRPKGGRLDWAGISKFKLTWKVSKAAILYRARQLDLITEDQYKSGVIRLRRTGEATKEREDDLIQAEPPELLQKSFNVLATRKNLYSEDISKKLKIKSRLLEKIVGFELPKNPNTFTSVRPRLVLVN